MASKEALRAKTVGNVAFLREQHQNAIQAFQEFFSLAPEEGLLALTNITACHLAAQQYQEAVDAGFRALQERRKPALKISAKLFYRMGRAFQELGQPARARIMYKRALNCCWNANFFELYSSQLPPSANTVCIPPLMPCRRKLFDRGMQSFSLGNTAAMNVFHSVDLDALPERHINLNESMSASERNITEEPLRVLFVGVGDIRNPLCFLRDINTARPVEIHMNDIAVPTLARDLVLFKVSRTGSTADVVSIWCNALLSPGQYGLLRAATAEIIESLQPHVDGADEQNGLVEVRLEDGLVMHSPAWFLLEVVELLKLWEVCAFTHVELGDMRFRMFKTAYALHSGVTLAWLQFGLSYLEHLRLGPDDALLEGDDLAAAIDDWRANPTLLDVSKFEWLDIQGPFNAFLQTQNFGRNDEQDTTQSPESRLSATLHECWNPLIEAFKVRLQSDMVQIRIWPGDGACMMEDPSVYPYAMPRELKFDCIDTSNVADYIGMWTLLLPALERTTDATRQPFVQIQHMIYTQGVPQFLHDQGLVDNAYETMFRILGVSYEALNNPLNPKDDWPYIRFTRQPFQEVDKVEDSVVVDLLIQVFQATITHLSLPITDGPNNSDPFRAFRRGWDYKPAIATTFLRMLRFFHAQLPHYRHLVPQVVDKILSSRDVWEACPCGEQRRMQFEVALQMENWRVHTLTGEDLGFNHKLLQWATLQSEKASLNDGLTRYAGILMLSFNVEPTYDIDGLRGGIFEPALCCICVRDSHTRKAIQAANGVIDRTLPEYARVGEAFAGAELFRLLQTSSPRDVQIIDFVQYNTVSRTVTVLMPEAQFRGNRGFANIMLADAQTYEIIAAPLAVSACAVTELV